MIKIMVTCVMLALGVATPVASAQDYAYNRPGEQFTYFIVGFKWTPTTERVIGSSGVVPADYYLELRDRTNARNKGFAYYGGPCRIVTIAYVRNISGTATVLGNARYVGASLRVNAIGSVPMQKGATFQLCGGEASFAGLSMPRGNWGHGAEICFQLSGSPGALANATIFAPGQPMEGVQNTMCSLTLPRLLANPRNVWAAMPWVIR